MKIIHKIDNGVTLEMLKEIDPRWTSDLMHKYMMYRAQKAYSARRGRTAFKDSSRQKVYNAEFQYIAKCGRGIEFKTPDQADRYLQRIMKSKTYAKLGGKAHVYLQMKRDMGLRSGTAGRAHWNGKIDLCPQYGMNEYTLLHEIAHQCGHMHHDIGFRQTLVKLVSRFVSREQGDTLAAVFKKAGLKAKLNTTIREPDQWLNSYFRMQNARTKLA